jgi:hypothetical protein
MAAFVRRKRRRNYFEIAQNLGLGSATVICLDAGDATSYPGSGTQWLDLSGNANHFNFGATTAAPTFNGTAGRLSNGEYLSTDGGDVVTIAGGNPAFVETMHKAGAAWTVILPGYWAGSAATAHRVCGTNAGVNNTGFDIGFNGTDGMVVALRNGTGSPAVNQNAAAFLGGATTWNFFSVSINTAVGAGGLRYRRNTTTDTDDSTATAPSVSNATYSLQLFAGGNAGTLAPANTRMTGFLLLNRALTDAESLAFFDQARRRLET